MIANLILNAAMRFRSPVNEIYSKIFDFYDDFTKYSTQKSDQIIMFLTVSQPYF